jgi:hypothetical protein
MSPSFAPPPKGDLAHLARLGRFLIPYRRHIALALTALVTAAACVLALGQGLRYVVDAGFGSGDPRLLNSALAGIVTIAVILASATWFRFYLMMSTGERVIADLRRAVYGHVLALTPAFFDAARTGELASRLTNDSEQIRQVIGFGFSMFLRNGLMTIGALALLFTTSPKLAALIVLGVPATLIPILLMGRRVRRLSRLNQDRVGDVSAYIDESIHEIRTVQAYRHEDRAREHFGRAAAEEGLTARAAGPRGSAQPDAPHDLRAAVGVQMRVSLRAHPPVERGDARAVGLQPPRAARVAPASERYAKIAPHLGRQRRLAAREPRPVGDRSGGRNGDHAQRPLVARAQPRERLGDRGAVRGASRELLDALEGLLVEHGAFDGQPGQRAPSAPGGPRGRHRRHGRGSNS